ncbi:beta-ketoacyl synthase N-terminal-like domain-containing protein [Xenorhabdus ishibashii]|uniref:beta-ketoacyl synthase N-terminal-like domain-containing protein n=1 Tax=Xenorhabdus ishibashii TaxID=1034471 RepID=UPI003CC6AC02
MRNRYGDLPDSSLYALTAAHEAVLDAGLESGDEVLREAAVFAGNNEAQADILDERVEGNDSRWIQYGYSGYQVAADVRKSLRAKGPIMTVHNTCASANVAMETALQALQSGVINTAVVGAADAFSLKVWSGFYMLNALGEQRCLPFSSHRRFITISEGAAFLILQREDSLLPHQIPIAELVAVFSNNDAKHPTNPDSESVHVCHKQLLITAGISADDVDVIYAHGTGTRANDVVEAAIFAQDYPRAQVTAIKGTVGHMMGTAGAIGAVASCLTLKTQQVPPTQTITPEFDFNLVTEVSPPFKRIRYVQNNSFGFGGNNAISLFRLP